MDNDASSVEIFGLTEIFQVVIRRWRWLVGTIVVIVALALALSLQQDKRYVATSTVLLSTATEGDLNDVAQAPQVLDRNVANQLQLLGSIDVQRAVEQAYEGDLDVSDVTASTAEPGSDAVDISIGGNDPEGVAELANVYARTYIDYTQQARIDNLTNFGARLQEQQTELTQRRAKLLEPLDALDARIANGESGLAGQRADLAADLTPQLAAIDSIAASLTQQQEALRVEQNRIATGAPQLIHEAEPPDSPESPKPVRDAVIGFMVGVILGLVLAFARDFLDETIRTTDDLDRILAGKVPVLGVIPDAELAEAKTLPDATTHTPAAEAYRALRTSVRFAELDRPMKVIQVTSASPGEGKTTTVANLAAVLTQAGHRVAVACCDLRRPNIQTWFGAPVAPGMSDVVLGERTLADAIQVVGERLYLLAAGTAPMNPSELLGSSRAERVISALAEEMDYVLLDTTPVLPVTDSIVVSRFADATILVVGARRTSRHELQRALGSLEQASAPLIGVVFNRAVAGDRNSYGYSYGYGYAAYEGYARGVAKPGSPEQEPARTS